MATELVKRAGEADVVLWSYRAEGLKGTCDMGGVERVWRTGDRDRGLKGVREAKEGIV